MLKKVSAPKLASDLRLPRVPNVSQECDKIYVLEQAPEKHESAAATLALEQDRERTIVEDLTSKVDLQPT